MIHARLTHSKYAKKLNQDINAICGQFMDGYYDTTIKLSRGPKLVAKSLNKSQQQFNLWMEPRTTRLLRTTRPMQKPTEYTWRNATHHRSQELIRLKRKNHTQ